MAAMASKPRHATASSHVLIGAREPRQRVAEGRRAGRTIQARLDDCLAGKGLNLAVSDVFYLSRALAETYKTAKT
jgi:hypothetical protein